MGKKPKLIPLIIILIILGLFGLLYDSGLRVNITDSMPRGLYFLHSSKNICRWDLVAVKLSVKQLLLGLEIGYIKNENTLLFKRVIAIPGDTVTLTDGKIIVGESEYLTPTYSKDEHNREMCPKEECIRIHPAIGSRRK